MKQSASGDCKNLNNGEHICRLFEEIATVSFFKRVFQWRKILLSTGAARVEYGDLIATYLLMLITWNFIMSTILQHFPYTVRLSRKIR